MKDALFIPRRIEHLYNLFNPLIGTQLVRAYRDPDGVGQKGGCEASDRFGPGGGNCESACLFRSTFICGMDLASYELTHDGLSSLLGGVRNDAANVIFETLVQHAVRFVQDKVFDAAS